MTLDDVVARRPAEAPGRRGLAVVVVDGDDERGLGARRRRRRRLVAAAREEVDGAEGGVERLGPRGDARAAVPLELARGLDGEGRLAEPPRGTLAPRPRPRDVRARPPAPFGFGTSTRNDALKQYAVWSCR